MFTGIIEDIGEVIGLELDRKNLKMEIRSRLTPELKIDQSIAHNGVCLTVERTDATSFSVTAISETLDKSNLNELKIGGLVNLERAMKLGDRLDGHLVQGHVDTTALCTGVMEEGGSWIYTFEYDGSKEFITVQKGSITVNGVSLTVAESMENIFRVAIIPYTYEHTNFKNIQTGNRVNLEFDILGKYIKKLYLSNI